MNARDAHQSAGQPVAYIREKLPEDDWYGVSDARERRKRQNRLNQRAHRFRIRLERIGGPISLNAQWHLLPAKALFRFPLSIESTRQVQCNLSGQVAKPESTPSSYLYRDLDRNKDTANASWFTTTSAGKVDKLWVEMPEPCKTRALLQQIAQFHASFQLNHPRADHLLSLTRVNVHRAFVSNMVTLGITWEWMRDDSISPFSVARPGFFDLDHAIGPFPDSLHPTEIQRNCVHHTWIDLFPCPVMRNNLIRVGNEWDDEELCTDIMGFWDGTATGSFGLIIWGEPSDPKSWEITEGFLKKWGWVVHGCVDLMWSTNYWRAERGERPLFSTIEVYRSLDNKPNT